jgi:hypothetical protein
MYCDTIECSPPEGEPFLRRYPGTTYRAARRGEQPTHFPHVHNELGFMGFVVSSPETGITEGELADVRALRDARRRQEKAEFDARWQQQFAPSGTVTLELHFKGAYLTTERSAAGVWTTECGTTSSRSAARMISESEEEARAVVYALWQALHVVVAP